ncbi:hypothetical protein Nepgr_018066 [Nepenthes gracilis]|uniref:Uncharacterized protein n=1 Tax=Nepenthes gracilis TaxID=150966 RepID=A0AAD3SSL6_NEPGR|nr:hypothetical protein Nepgr_018066 [Nepenthes gracilis]
MFFRKERKKKRVNWVERRPVYNSALWHVMVLTQRMLCSGREIGAIGPIDIFHPAIRFVVDLKGFFTPFKCKSGQVSNSEHTKTQDKNKHGKTQAK